MPEAAPTGQIEYMTFAQTDAIVFAMGRFLRGEICNSELLSVVLTAWRRSVTPYSLYVHPAWRPVEERERAKAAGAVT